MFLHFYFIAVPQDLYKYEVLLRFGAQVSASVHLIGHQCFRGWGVGDFLVAVRRPLSWLIISLIELSALGILVASVFVRSYRIDFILLFLEKSSHGKLNCLLFVSSLPHISERGGSCSLLV